MRRSCGLYRAVQEAHFAQFSEARTTDVPMGREGMYVREFPPQMDWQHISEGLTTFNLMGLASPRDRKLIARTRRFADFYTGRDPAAPNYDPQRRLIRSMFNGSLGPLMRPATMLDWAGDPFDRRAVQARAWREQLRAVPRPLPRIYR